MGDKNAGLRLDEILVWEGLVTEDQIKEVLARQKEEGGRIGSHLLRQGFIDEPGLVKALAKQFNCDGVVLSDLEIPEIIIKFIPQRIAFARKVLPFDYDPEANILKVACEDPRDKHLADELKFIVRGKKLKLFVAAELSLTAAIEKYYSEADQDDPEEAEAADDSENEQQENHPTWDIAANEGSRERILLVTDDEEEGETIRTILEQRNYEVTVTDSADDAIDIIDGIQFTTVFIKDTVPGDYIDLIDRLRKTSPRTRVRYYEHAARLLVEDESSATAYELLVKNLDLFTSMLASRDKLRINHSAIVGQYVDRLCQRIGLPDKDRMIITSAAYLHDLARFYYTGSEVPNNPRSEVEMNARLLDSLNFSPLVVAVVNSMYINLRKKYTKRLPIEVLGGNIITMVDIFCETVPGDEPISIDKFEQIKEKLHDMTGRLFLSEVVDAFIAMIQEEMLTESPDGKFGQVMIYSAETEQLATIEQRLKNEGFRPVTHEALEPFTGMFRRGQPDMMILIQDGDSEAVNKFVDQLIDKGVNFHAVPTFVLLEGEVATESTSLLEKGIEDVIPLSDNLGLLIVKMKKIRSRIEAEAANRQKLGVESGSYGNLQNMNLIDLLQALGPSRKTVKIDIAGPDGEFVLYLDQGEIRNAIYGDKSGAEAVYEAMTWSRGSWRIEPISDRKLPDANNDQSNESILMEGCRLLDERLRTQADATTERIHHV